MQGERGYRKLRSGALPRSRRAKTWIGPGSARPCMACDQTIARDDTEVECDDLNGQPLRFHKECFEAWETESGTSGLGRYGRRPCVTAESCSSPGCWGPSSRQALTACRRACPGSRPSGCRDRARCSVRRAAAARAAPPDPGADSWTATSRPVRRVWSPEHWCPASCRCPAPRRYYRYRSSE